MSPKVLVIEDQPSIHDLLEFFLEKKGYRVWWAETGKEGVALAEKEKPDVVLIDVRLSDLGGIEVLRRIRAFDKEAKLFLFSGLYDEEQDKEARVLGGQGFIDKAQGVDAAVEAVEKAIKEKYPEGQ